MSAAQVESRPTPSTAAAYDTPPATTSNSNPRSSTRPGPSGEPGSHRQGGGAGGAPGGGRDRRRRGKAPAAGAAESDHQGAQARGGGRNGGGGGRSGGAQAEVNGDSAAQQNGHRNQGASNRSANGGRGRGQGQGRPARGKANDGHAQGQTDPALDNAPGSSGANGGRQRQGRGKAKENPTSSSSADASAQPGTEPVAPISTRKRNFGGKITTDEADSTERGSADVKGKGVAPAPVPPLIREYADLRSRLVAELGSGQYECAICYNTLTTRQPCWSCDQCYTVLHMSCTKKWASTSVDQANAQLAMQEDPEIRARRGTWRCPGCQFAREDVPQAYWCWCARVKDPQARGGLNPHSCGQRCGKGSCPHGGCAEPCHPGPCAPCAVTVSKRCHCGKHVLPIRCSQLNPSARAAGAGLQPGVASIPSEAPAAVQIERGISCSEACGKLLNCGTHSCAAVCHPGACTFCAEHINAKCYCGLQEKDLVCGSEGTAQRCVRDDDNTEWTGLWTCDTVQQKPYDCGKHFYEQSCSSSSHTTDRPPCPRSPERIKRCPCGKTALTDRTSFATTRNMKLADALGINYAEKGAPAVYEADTIKFYATHRAFGDEVERAFTEFVTSSRNGMILPAAKREHRKFTHELAAVYKLSSESVDSEPKRSVSIRRLQGSRVPSPLLSEVWANALAEQTTTTTASSSSKLSTAPIDRNRQNAPGASALGNLPLNAILLESVFGHSAASLREHLETLPAGLLNSVTFELRWVTDENVLMTFEQQQQQGGGGSSGVPATLVRIRSALREMLGRTGLASRALLCVVGRDGAVLRTEEDTGPSVSNTASGTAVNGHPASTGVRSTAGGGGGGGGGGAPAKKLGGWAAIASGSASTQASRLANHASSSVWDSGVRRSAAGGPGPAASGSALNNNHQAGGPSSSSSSSGRIVLTTSAANSARASPRMELLPAFAREATPDDWEID
ncbi:unnamed protein product [Tilletia caries]|nr:unnamed protein product [Tilletia caries]